MVGLGLWLILPSLFIKGIVFIVITISGFYSSNIFSKILEQNDPSQIVIDEIAGLWITLLMIEIFLHPSLKIIIAGFILFRALDIIKPYPITKLEQFKGGVGIMLDDIGAGILAGLILIVIQSI